MFYLLWLLVLFQFDVDRHMHVDRIRNQTTIDVCIGYNISIYFVGSSFQVTYL